MDTTSLNLTDLPDFVLLDLFEYLDSTSLYFMSRLNLRFSELVLNSRLWRYIDARRNPNTHGKIDYCYDRINKRTQKFCLRACNCCQRFSLVKYIHLQNIPDNLTVVALENQQISGLNISMSDFPSSLEEISFKDSIIHGSSMFFKKSSEKMRNLRVLMLDSCQNIADCVIMSVSKYENLKVLSLFRCYIETSIPYFSIAGLHGFKSLVVLDIRCSGLGDSFLKCMYRIPALQAFYFEMRALPEELEVDEVSDVGSFEYTETDNDGKCFSLAPCCLYKDPYNVPDYKIDETTRLYWDHFSQKGEKKRSFFGKSGNDDISLSSKRTKLNDGSHDSRSLPKTSDGTSPVSDTRPQSGPSGIFSQPSLPLKDLPASGFVIKRPKLCDGPPKFLPLPPWSSSGYGPRSVPISGSLLSIGLPCGLGSALLKRPRSGDSCQELRSLSSSEIVPKGSLPLKDPLSSGLLKRPRTGDGFQESSFCLNGTDCDLQSPSGFSGTVPQSFLSLGESHVDLSKRLKTDDSLQEFHSTPSSSGTRTEPDFRSHPVPSGIVPQSYPTLSESHVDFLKVLEPSDSLQESHDSPSSSGTGTDHEFQPPSGPSRHVLQSSLFLRHSPVESLNQLNQSSDSIQEFHSSPLSSGTRTGNDFQLPSGTSGIVPERSSHLRNLPADSLRQIISSNTLEDIPLRSVSLGNVLQRPRHLKVLRSGSGLPDFRYTRPPIDHDSDSTSDSSSDEDDLSQANGKASTNKPEVKTASIMNVETDNGRPNEDDDDRRAVGSDFQGRREGRLMPMIKIKPGRVRIRLDFKKRVIALKKLSLRGFPNVTDQTLANLEHLKLDMLDVTHTRVSRAGLDSFLIVNPNCVVIHHAVCYLKSADLDFVAEGNADVQRSRPPQ